MISEVRRKLREMASWKTSEISISKRRTRLTFSNTPGRSRKILI